MNSNINKLNLFVDQFSIFANDTKPVFNIIVNDFIVFAENKEVLKNIITSYLTNNCLSTTNYYQEALDLWGNSNMREFNEIGDIKGLNLDKTLIIQTVQDSYHAILNNY